MENLTLTIERYERNDNTIHSNCTLVDSQYLYNFQGIERNGYEIPEGTYDSRYCHSPKFSRRLYLIDVIGRQGIRIHVGNSYKDVTGCLAIAEFRMDDMIINSKKTVELFHRISKGRNIKIIVCSKKQSKRPFWKSLKNWALL